ncbi:MAG: hypothetical protein AB7P07_04625 [Hyphomonadaceae bacterium]
MKRKRRTAPRTRAGFAGLQTMATSLVALFALAFNALAIQTHVHPLSPPVAAAIEQGVEAHGGAHVVAAVDKPLCALCLALAASGRATPPAGAAIADEPGAAALDTLPAPVQHARLLSHAWLSRGPPIAL